MAILRQAFNKTTATLESSDMLDKEDSFIDKNDLKTINYFW